MSQGRPVSHIRPSPRALHSIKPAQKNCLEYGVGVKLLPCTCGSKFTHGISAIIPVSFVKNLNPGTHGLFKAFLTGRRKNYTEGSSLQIHYIFRRGALCYGFGCEFGFASCCPLPLLNFAIPGTWLLFPSLLYCRGWDLFTFLFVSNLSSCCTTNIIIACYFPLYSCSSEPSTALSVSKM